MILKTLSRRFFSNNHIFGLKKVTFLGRKKITFCDKKKSLFGPKKVGFLGKNICIFRGQKGHAEIDRNPTQNRQKLGQILWKRNENEPKSAKKSSKINTPVMGIEPIASVLSTSFRENRYAASENRTRGTGLGTTN